MAAALAQELSKLSISGVSSLEALTAAAGKGPAAEIHLISHLPAVLKATADKDASVRAAADAAGLAIMSTLNRNAVKLALPALFEAMADPKWQTKEAATKFLGHLASASPEQISVYLPEIVPVVTNCMVDLKPTVRTAATEALTKCCTAIGNRDIEPFVPHLIRCIGAPGEVPDCVHKLSATTFVQSVDARTLSILVPLLVRGLTDRTTPIRRKACVIIRNMAKLVDDPVDAANFVATLLPNVKYAMEGMSNPEARDVATDCHKILESINTSVEAAPKAQVDEVLVALNKAAEAASVAVKGDGAEEAARYVAGMAANLIDVKNFEEGEWTQTVTPYLAPFCGDAGAAALCKEFHTACFQEAQSREMAPVEEEEGEDLCNCEFSLAYGGKILLNNARLHLKRGQRYGLCGPNGSGKSTLMRAIANGQLDGFPPKTELRTVYVEHDIDASEAETPVVEFVVNDDMVKEVMPARERIIEVLESVGFDAARQASPVASLSGGWKMKLALARAMLMNADIMLLDEPTNHLDTTNVAWLVSYLTGLKGVTSVVVSHDSGFLDAVCSSIIHYEDNFKLKKYLGNLSKFVEQRPEAAAYYNLADASTKWVLPEPGYLEGVTSKDRAILKMRQVCFKYPTAEQRILNDVSLQVSLNSRVGVLGPNGAGKSTLIKLLTGELEAESGLVWKHPNLRVAYVAQHAFHHIEDHLDMSPNQYIQWRYATGEDRESLDKVSRKMKEEEEKNMKEVKVVDGVKRVVEKLLARRKLKRGYEYEVQWLGQAETSWLTRDRLEEMGFSKMLTDIDMKEAAAAGLAGKPLTAKNVEEMLHNLGLPAEFATHSQIRGLSGGQKVKLVLGAAMWQQPHILVLDEPTNYLDRESLGAMASALAEYGGGVVIVSHHSEFVNQVCGEKWNVGGGVCAITGQSAAALDAMKLEWKRQEETTDAFGNTIKVKAPKKELSRKEKKAKAKANKARRERGEEVSDDDEDWE
ncbi:elongation factor 3 [Micractinium conductrix]|uniref:Elongation factor 3 n=1 Tax=Micractinium conductrix TaxID=554055 RepID=A0A2P6VE01_9CHLO|nr:elongation factor 3 [Micractinium conductrix]|eukprot:PSC72325.1 elongation factor 3 [Micractinium conductrix]